jgi:integrase
MSCNRPELVMESNTGMTRRNPRREPWNKGKIVGQKAPLKLKDIWELRVRLADGEPNPGAGTPESRHRQQASRVRPRQAQVRDVCHGEQIAARAIVMQQKIQRPVQFEITPPTRETLQRWIKHSGLRSEDFLLPSRMHGSAHIGTRQYARILKVCIGELGLDTAAYGTHSIRRTKPTLIYRRTKNLRAVQLLLGHTKLESAVRYLGIEVDDALEMAEQTEV